jgi:hypothetical protein
MSKSTQATAVLRGLKIGIAVIQLLDIIIHAATNQIEILRVSSNIIILLWLAVVASGKVNTKFLAVAISSIGLYLVLNLVFLAREGITNVEHGGELRVALFLLMLLTITLSALLIYTQEALIK